MPERSDGGAAGLEAAPGRPGDSIVRRMSTDLLGWLRRRFPIDTREPRTRSGYASDSRREPFYRLVALGIALGFASLWLWIVRVEPVPPGGDPSTWILTSYPFVGLPTTAGVQPLAYPPLAFPFVGLAVVLGHGPLLGGRIYMAASIVVLGLACFMLNRSLLERPSLALLGEGLLLGEPDFQQLYYFGGYPNIFALIFLVLALAFLLRFLRSRRPAHLFWFWVATTACLLSHSLTGVVLVAILAFLAAGLFIAGRLPRTLVLSRAGLAGVAVFVIGVGGYYLGTYFASVDHPTYFDASPTTTKPQLLPTVLRPFYLTTPVRWVTGAPAFLSSDQALAIVVGATFGILAAIGLTWRWRPDWLTTPWLALAGWFLALFVATLGAYVLSIPIDYRRLPYFLYGPAILAALFPLDWAISEWLTRDWTAWLARRAARHRRPPPTMPLRWRTRVDPTLTLGALAVLGAVAALSTTPSGVGYESYYTLYAHDDQFLTAVNAIADSGIAGNLLATTAYVAHWPSTITDTRTTYVPALSNGNAYATAHVADGETTSITLAGRYTVTNTLVGATVPGVAAGDFNSSPIVGAFAGNIYQPLFQMPSASMTVNLSDGAQYFVAPPGGGAPPIHATDGGFGYSFVFPVPGAVVLENVTAIPSTDEVSISLDAQANGSAPLVESLQARFTSVPLVAGNLTAGVGLGTFVWSADTRNGNFSTYGSVAPATALGRLIGFNSTPGAAPAVLLRMNASVAGGSPVLGVAITLATPAAYNEIPAIGPWLDSAQVWDGWSVRFLLDYSQVATLRISTSYLQSEYHAALYVSSGPWSVYLLAPSLTGD